MVSTLKNKLKNMELTKMEQKIAVYLSEDESRICFLSATEIANHLNISDASVIRFAKSLGYSGFNEMKKDFQSQMSNQMAADDPNSPSPLERFSRVNAHRRDGSLTGAMLDVVLSNLQTTIDQKDFALKIETATELLMCSKRKVVIGFKGCAGLTSKTELLLGALLPSVFTITNISAAEFLKMLDLRQEDCLLIFYFPRYPSSVEMLAAMAHEVGARIIFFTDRQKLDIANDDDVIITVGIDNIAYNNSHVATNFILDVIGANLSRQINAGAIKSRLSRIDEMTARYNLY